MHTPDCLIVTPAAGVVEPMSQLLVLVSCNPSIRSRGVQLPWSGAILVVCDDQKQVQLFTPTITIKRLSVSNWLKKCNSTKCFLNNKNDI